MNSFLARLQSRYSIIGSSFQVLLGSGKNSDHPSSEQVIIKPHKVSVKSVEDAQKAVRKFIDENSLGAGSWYAADAGWVFENGKKFCRIAYNGSIHQA